MVHYCPKCRYFKRQPKSWRQIASWLGQLPSLRSWDESLLWPHSLLRTSSWRFSQPIPAWGCLLCIPNAPGVLHASPRPTSPPCRGYTWSPDRICPPVRGATRGRVLEGQHCAWQKAGALGSEHQLPAPSWTTPDGHRHWSPHREGHPAWGLSPHKV